MALWRTNGYAKTTVADICRAAGVSRALFYFYFPTKEDIVLHDALDPLFFASALAGGEALAQLTREACLSSAEGAPAAAP